MWCVDRDGVERHTQMEEGPRLHVSLMYVLDVQCTLYFLLPCGLAIVIRLPVAISLLWTGLTMYKVAGSEYLISYRLFIVNIMVALWPAAAILFLPR
jgi:hypothetical protein